MTAFRLYSSTTILPKRPSSSLRCSDFPLERSTHLGTSPLQKHLAGHETLWRQEEAGAIFWRPTTCRKVQAIGYEQSLAIQSAALLAERERESRLKGLQHLARSLPWASRVAQNIG